MKLYVLSDLHLDDYEQAENEKLASELPEADVFVIPGDFVNYGYTQMGRIKDFLKRVEQKYKYIVAVVGNHDNWGSDLGHSYNSFLQIVKEIPKLTVLNNNTVVLKDFEDYIFYGGTLWYKGSYKLWIDERRIIDGSVDIQSFNKQFKENLSNLNPEGKKLICVSHHLPSELCIAPEFKGADTNPFFVDASCEKLIVEKKPIYWFHGHTHEVVDQQLDSTRIIANPRGYKGEHNLSFKIDSLNRIYDL